MATFKKIINILESHPKVISEVGMLASAAASQVHQELKKHKANDLGSGSGS